MLLCWMSLCWVSLCWMSLCWVSWRHKKSHSKRNKAFYYFRGFCPIMSDMSKNLASLVDPLFYKQKAVFSLFSLWQQGEDENDTEINLKILEMFQLTKKKITNCERTLMIFLPSYKVLTIFLQTSCKVLMIFLQFSCLLAKFLWSY